MLKRHRLLVLRSAILAVIAACSAFVGCASSTQEDARTAPGNEANGAFTGSWNSVASNAFKDGDPASVLHGQGSPDTFRFAPSGVPTAELIGNHGGVLRELRFAVVGDTRPQHKDDTAGYPTTVIRRIFSDLAARSGDAPFAISTGDYAFASPWGYEAPRQYSIYMSARALFPNPVFPAMGNHECTGYTRSNCGAENVDGTPAMYRDYLSTFLGPLGKTTPYYAISVDALDGTWTSKLVFIAANAWDNAQEKWLTREMAKPTTYTFVVRHEPAAADTAPGVRPSERIMAQNPYTLAFVGHEHAVRHMPGSREVTVGNGGAPLQGGDYGYVLVARRPSDGAIQVDSYNYETNAADASFHFAVTAEGAATAPTYP